MLTIGEFSRLSRVTPRMLRHYDALGLLRPEMVGDNGYRYYRQEQLSDLLRIQWLNSCGFPLKELGPLLSLDREALLPHLRRRRDELLQELERQQEVLRRMEADILRMEGTNMETPYHVVLIEDPEQKVFSIRETIGVNQYHDFFERLYQEAEKRGLKQAGPIQMLYHDEEFSHEHSDVEAQMVVAQDGPDVKIKPAYTCAAVQHRGPYENLHLAYNALCGWLAEHTEYRICGPAMDRYFGDPDSTPPDQLETGVLFPVRRV
ncbi:MerR family DNA-binding transcriptional regulator [Pseudoflavonifractor sp. 60]|uniref:MerR family transcriptional regulator n=1 Tax=Pseudoflavonifractor sp. 60 TaxID=2304576 RepID=UPI001369AEC8|nr:MerR family transcriptional regulator [Pseudoflavonifractor sp. 60]NBI68084.1 MerR family DNA-binding transcriptional regulator [Pseudoflavonifractor sp. 60]